MNKQIVYPLEALSQTLNGQLLHAKNANAAVSVCIDSRTLQPGDWFICIRGERTDGHLHLEQALDKGAAGAVVQPERIPENLHDREFPQIRVPDPNLALREWASSARSMFPGKVLGITGSNGKTSTKEILARLCRRLDGMVDATHGNLNNLIGVPLTLLGASSESQWWVIEMGTNQFGEIGELSRISRPDGVILTSIAQSHLEFLKNTEGVVREKSDIMKGMSPGSPLVLPADVKHLDFIRKQATQAGVKIIRYALADADFDAEWKLKLREVTSGETVFELFGEEFHPGKVNPLQLRNLAASLVLLYECGVDQGQLQQTVSGLELTVPGRFEWKRLDRGWLVDDTYNANPGSFRGVLDSIRSMHSSESLTVVAGPMAELGKDAKKMHQEIGESIRHSGCSKLLVLGGTLGEGYLEGWKSSGGSTNDAIRFEDLGELTDAFHNCWNKEGIVLVKGSRSAAMERFVNAVITKNQ